MQNLPHSVGQAKRTISPPLGARESTKLPTHLRQVKLRSLTHLFSAESLGFSRSRVGKRALYLPKEQGRLHSPTLLGKQNAQSPPLGARERLNSPHI
ncbi:hypothetical protein T4A_12312 [Trichinella pseudospiralis]|uniref:Uncharacterized protein n=1 Tax=Trichinella pseudospiralis TaxID=6337 RepID=A0A0V1DS02_TRIPS|nr:hypothetical protein T4A_12312 [Trichinella pseudospiralis]